MQNNIASLYELALAEQEARNGAAIAAIQSRRNDVTELQRLTEALAARGLRVRPAVSTHAVGALAVCRLQLWLSCTMRELGQALDWLAAADVDVARQVDRDTGLLRVYRLRLRGFEIQLNAQLVDAVVSPHAIARIAPAAA